MTFFINSTFVLSSYVNIDAVLRVQYGLVFNILSFNSFEYVPHGLPVHTILISQG